MTLQVLRLFLLLMLATSLAHAEGSTPSSHGSQEDPFKVAFKVSSPPLPGRPNLMPPRSPEASVEKSRRVQARSIKVVGGEEAAPGQWPFAVAIAFENTQGTLTQYCAGSLIEPDTVLTAAHCEVAAGHFAIIGRHDLAQSGGRSIRIVSVTSHAHFDKGSFRNDIALIRLAHAVPNAHTVELAGQDWKLSEAQRVTAIGWGATREGDSPSFVLRQASFSVAPQAECAAQYGNRPPIQESMLCASAPGTKDTCQGDSGGPLLMEAPGGKVVQVGITSFGIGCARPGFHGVYTRVSSFRPWIDKLWKR
jgi:secreted trypsin-like serine protease